MGLDQSRAQRSELAGEERRPGLCLCAISSPCSVSPPLAKAVMSAWEIWGGEGQVSPHQLLQLLLDGGDGGVSWTCRKASLDASQCAPPPCSRLHGPPPLLRPHQPLLLHTPSLLETKTANSRCLCEASEALPSERSPSTYFPFTSGYDIHAGDWGLIPRLGRSPGEGNGNPL